MSSQYPERVTSEDLLRADAIREVARAMPVYGRKGQPAKFDGDDVRAFLREYADSIDKPTKSRSRRPADRQTP